MPWELVTAEAADSPPLVGSVCTRKSTVAPSTRLLAASRTVAEMVLLPPTATEAGPAWTEIWLGVTATKSRVNCAVTPVPLALTIEGPALTELIATVALPAASVITGVEGTRFARGGEGDGGIRTGAPPFSQVTVTFCEAPRFTLCHRPAR